MSTLIKLDDMSERIIRVNELCERLGVTRQTIWEWEKEGKIPPSFKLTENGRAAGWLSSDIDKFLVERKNTVNENQKEVTIQ